MSVRNVLIECDVCAKVIESGQLKRVPTDPLPGMAEGTWEERVRDHQSVMTRSTGYGAFDACSAACATKKAQQILEDRQDGRDVSVTVTMRAGR